VIDALCTTYVYKGKERLIIVLPLATWLGSILRELVGRYATENWLV
jgi:hypothetical protein